MLLRAELEARLAIQLQKVEGSNVATRDRPEEQVAEASAKTPAAEPRTKASQQDLGALQTSARAEELQPIATTPFSEGNQPKIGEKIDEDAAALAAASGAESLENRATRLRPEKQEPRSPQGEEALALDEVAETSAKTPPSEPRTKASQQDLGALQTSAQAKEELQPIATTPFSEGNQPKIGEKIDEDAAALAAASGAESLENRATRLRPEEQEPRSPQARALDEMAETSAKTPAAEPRTKASQQDLGALQTSAQAKEAVTNWHGVEGRVDFVEQAVVDLNIEVRELRGLLLALQASKGKGILTSGYKVLVGLAAVGIVVLCRLLLYTEEPEEPEEAEERPTAWMNFSVCGLVGLAMAFLCILVTQYYTDFNVPRPVWPSRPQAEAEVRFERID